jgi:MFS family permease
MTERSEVQTTEVAVPSPWLPLRVAAFRALWLAVLVSNIGTWMQTVGAQWLLVDRPGASTLVALVQTASMLPILLLALPAGVLADTFDRRHLLIVVQLFEAVVAVTLTVLTAVGQMPPALLLTLTFALGAGNALTLPAFQALIPDLVPRPELPAASALGAISVNVARAVGPAIAGLLIAKIGVAAVFGFNALGFIVFAAVLLCWRPGSMVASDDPERFAAALRAGGRYVRHSLIVRRILLRTLLFIAPATVLWALLPLVASRQLHMGASGYGVLLAALGIGAIAGAFLLPRLGAWMSSNRTIALASLAYVGTLVVVALVHRPVLVTLALVPAGVAWLGVLSSVNAALQMYLPGWVRARGLSMYQIIVFGGQGVAAFAWGLLAQRVGLEWTFLVAAAVLAAGTFTVRGWPLFETTHMNREPAVYWPEPHLALDPDPDSGPVVVTATYTVPPERQRAFLDAMADVRRTRQRTGATQWGIFREGEAPDHVVEVYLVPSWEEHLRQHGGRLTGWDQELEARAAALAEGPARVTHLLPTGDPNDR